MKRQLCGFILFGGAISSPINWIQFKSLGHDSNLYVPKYKQELWIELKHELELWLKLEPGLNLELPQINNNSPKFCMVAKMQLSSVLEIPNNPNILYGG